MQSACNQHAISMQSACNQHANLQPRIWIDDETVGQRRLQRARERRSERLGGRVPQGSAAGAHPDVAVPLPEGVALAVQVDVEPARMQELRTAPSNPRPKAFIIIWKEAAQCFDPCMLLPGMQIARVACAWHGHRLPVHTAPLHSERIGQSVRFSAPRDRISSGHVCPAAREEACKVFG